MNFNQRYKKMIDVLHSDNMVDASVKEAISKNIKLHPHGEGSYSVYDLQEMVKNVKKAREERLKKDAIKEEKPEEVPTT